MVGSRLSSPRGRPAPFIDNPVEAFTKGTAEDDGLQEIKVVVNSPLAHRVRMRPGNSTGYDRRGCWKPWSLGEPAHVALTLLTSGFIGFPGSLCRLLSGSITAWRRLKGDGNSSPDRAPFQSDWAFRARSARARNSAMFGSLTGGWPSAYAWIAHPSAVPFQR